MATSTSDSKAANKPEPPTSKETKPQGPDKAAKGAAVEPSGGDVFSLGNSNLQRHRIQSPWMQGRLFVNGFIAVAVVDIVLCQTREDVGMHGFLVVSMMEFRFTISVISCYGYEQFASLWLAVTTYPHAVSAVSFLFACIYPFEIT